MIFRINGDVAAAKEILNKELAELEKKGTVGKDNEKAIIIDGRTMGLVFEDSEAKRLFAELGIRSANNLCFINNRRVSPSVQFQLQNSDLLPSESKPEGRRGHLDPRVHSRGGQPRHWGWCQRCGHDSGLTEAQQVH